MKAIEGCSDFWSEEQARWAKEITHFIDLGIDRALYPQFSWIFKIESDMCISTTTLPCLLFKFKELHGQNPVVTIKVMISAYLWKELSQGVNLYVQQIGKCVMTKFGCRKRWKGFLHNERSTDSSGVWYRMPFSTSKKV